jgi:hypothetical protein
MRRRTIIPFSILEFLHCSHFPARDGKNFSNEIFYQFYIPARLRVPLPVRCGIQGSREEAGWFLKAFREHGRARLRVLPIRRFRKRRRCDSVAESRAF